MDDSSSKVRLVADFIRDQLQAHQHRHAAAYPAKPVPPLMVGVQGPQGAGKSFITGLVPAALSELSCGSLKTASLSLDDLYLTHEAQASLAASHPDNAMLKGRGPPGTHDLQLAAKTLDGLRALNENSAEVSSVSLPSYDKSAFEGQGDRSSEIRKVEGPVDLVILEGWCVGFRALQESELRKRYGEAATAAPRGDSAKVDTHPLTLAKQMVPFFADHSLEALTALNEALETYHPIWHTLDAFVELRPEKASFVWEWRLEQEHAMKRANGGRGMTDEQVGAFIARYMPCYELFDADYGSSLFHERHLRLIIDRQRRVVRTEYP